MKEERILREESNNQINTKEEEDVPKGKIGSGDAIWTLLLEFLGHKDGIRKLLEGFEIISNETVKDESKTIYPNVDQLKSELGQEPFIKVAKQKAEEKAREFEPEIVEEAITIVDITQLESFHSSLREISLGDYWKVGTTSRMFLTIQ